ncbi:UDP-glucose 4-epimerase GalE [Micrococcus sp.]|uniref:UDP-glucose 4-epimerase GalE n=1 Tax=Micrococcus sp. TaxID=1271 RepID=UPI002A91F719|nr:UDP-glucose 4-epimerase GalE [Micrococcus sp.]MDY6056148.1 UDP-glucose 4-epimerase GalE [Micrococcus sp.]
MRVLVTGGAGFLGSHTVAVLLASGHDVLVMDSFASGSRTAVERAGEVSGAPLGGGRLDLVTGDVRHPEQVADRLAAFAPDAVVHFAGLKSPTESVAHPAAYYSVNVAGTAQIAEAAARAGSRVLLFSSSATVYGDEAPAPVAEDAPPAPVSPYGWSKLMAEQVVRDVHTAHPGQRAAVLRYFNPVGAHPSGRMGEDPAGEPANLMPYVARVAAGHYPELKVFGADFATRDGSAVRDFIHVMDLAEAHVATLEWMAAQAEDPGVKVWNIGRGEGVTVFEMVRAFEEVTGRPVPHRVVGLRAGDIAESCAAVDAIAAEVGWRARRGVEDMVRDLWAWQQANPGGYGDRSGPGLRSA